VITFRLAVVVAGRELSGQRGKGRISAERCPSTTASCPAAGIWAVVCQRIWLRLPVSSTSISAAFFSGPVIPGGRTSTAEVRSIIPGLGASCAAARLRQERNSEPTMAKSPALQRALGMGVISGMT